MKTMIIFILSLIFFNVGSVCGQNKAKRDSIYYLLDTAAVPVKDRMFKTEIEQPYKLFVLRCKCYPNGANAAFSTYITQQDNAKYISQEDFHRLKTISLTELIAITANSPKEKGTKHHFFFLEPNGNKMKITRVYLLPPLKAKPPTDEGGVYVPGDH